MYYFVDRNECLRNGTGCHANATCLNFYGGHRCVCNIGYSGNGTNCTGMYCYDHVLFVWVVYIIKCSC